MLSWTVLISPFTTSWSTWPYNGRLISGVGPTVCSFLLPFSSAIFFHTENLFHPHERGGFWVCQGAIYIELKVFTKHPYITIWLSTNADCSLICLLQVCNSAFPEIKLSSKCMISWFFFLRKIKQCKVEFISRCLCSFLMDIIRAQKSTNMGLIAWNILCDFAPSNRWVIHTFLLLSFVSTWVVCPWPHSLYLCYWFSMRSVLVEYWSSYFIAGLWT